MFQTPFLKRKRNIKFLLAYCNDLSLSMLNIVPKAASDFFAPPFLDFLQWTIQTWHSQQFSGSQAAFCMHSQGQTRRCRIHRMLIPCRPSSNQQKTPSSPLGSASDIAKQNQLSVKQRSCAHVNSPCKRKCRINSAGPLYQSLLCKVGSLKGIIERFFRISK